MTASRHVADLPGPPTVPLLGNAHQLGRSDRMHAKAEEWCQRYGPIFRIKAGPRLMVGVGDEGAINEILRDRPEGYARSSTQNDVLQELRAPNSSRNGVKWGLFAVEGDEWKKQRRVVMGVLNANQMPRYFEIVRTASERLRGRLLEAARDGRSLEIFDLLTAYTIDVTTSLALGDDTNTLEHGDGALQHHLHRAITMIVRRLGAPVPYWRRLKLPADRALDRSVAEIYKAMEAALAQARARLEAEPERCEAPPNVLEGLLAAQKADPTIVDEEILFNLLSILIGGQDTTAGSLGWTVWLLGSSLEAQKRLAAETAGVFGDAAGVSSYADSEQLPYTEAVLRESARLKSVFPLLAVEPIEDTTICDTRIPAGTQVLLLLRYAARGAAGRVDEFLPERWLEDSDETRATRSLAFGAGPRFCPGRNLAFLESKAAISMLAHNFELELDHSGGPVQEVCIPAMAPQGLRVRLRERRAAAAL